MATYKEFHQYSIEKPNEFWTEQAQLIDWKEPFTQVCDFSRPPFAKWFVGGKTNLCYNAVDRHAAKRPNDRALIFISTETNEGFYFRRTAARNRAHGRHLSKPRRQEGRPRPDLHADDRPGHLCHPRGNPHRRHSFGRCSGGFASGSLATRIDDAKPT